MENSCQGIGNKSVLSFFKLTPLCFVLLSASVLQAQVSAAPVTQNFISSRDKPLYSNAPYMPYANPKAPKGGIFSKSSIGTFDNFQTLNGKGTAADGVQYLYDTLMTRSLNETAISYPLLATSVTVDPDDLSYAIFHLNPKAKFSDGTPVRAADVVFSFQALLDKGAPGIKNYLSEIKSVKALNDRDVRFDYKSNTNTEITAIVTEVPIYSKKDFAGKAYDRIMAIAPLGSGPYVIDRIDAGRAITYKRNPNYWAKDIAVNQGRNNFDLIKYVYYRNLDVAFEGFKAGQFFYQLELTARRWSLSYDFPAIKQGMLKKQVFKDQNPVPMQMFVLNNRREVLKDIHLRQALTYAYDFEWMNKALFFGLYSRLQSFFYNSDLAATGKPSADELKILNPLLPKLSPLERAGVLKDWKYPVSDASGFNRSNLLIARKILLDAGYRYQNGHLLDKNGKPITLDFIIHQENLTRSIIPFIRNVRRLGITVNLRTVDVPQYIERIRRFDYDITTQGIPQSISPGNEQVQFWGSSTADEQGNYNFAGIKNPAIDHVIDGLIRSPDRKTLVSYTQSLDRLLRAGYYVIPTYNKVGDFVATWDMYAQPKIPAKYNIGIEYWWVDPQKAARVSGYLKQQQSQK